jgi:hypothetical protein
VYDAPLTANLALDADVSRRIQQTRIVPMLLVADPARAALLCFAIMISSTTLTYAASPPPPKAAFVAKFSGTDEATTYIASLAGCVSSRLLNSDNAKKNAQPPPRLYATPSPPPQRYVDLLFSREVDVNMRVSSLGLFTDQANEPFSGDNIDELLFSFADHWQNVHGSGVGARPQLAPTPRWPRVDAKFVHALTHA